MVTDAGRLFEALANPTQREIIQLLNQNPHHTNKITNSTKMSGPAMSRHLRVLLQAGIVADERSPGDARVRVFRLRPESMVAIQAWLDQVRAQWDEQLRSFKRHVEGSRSR